MTVLLMIGTAKGLFLARREGDTWQVSAPNFPMTSVYAVGIDSRRETPRLLAGVESSHFGPSVAVSDDLGASWREPEEAPLAYKDVGAVVDAADRAGLATKVARLVPLVCVKG